MPINSFSVVKEQAVMQRVVQFFQTYLQTRMVTAMNIKNSGREQYLIIPATTSLRYT